MTSICSFSDLSFNPSCSSRAVKSEGPCSPGSVGAAAGPGSNDAQCWVKSYWPVRPVLSTTGRPAISGSPAKWEDKSGLRVLLHRHWR